MTDEVAGWIRGTGYLRGRRFHDAVDLYKRAVKTVENAIELDAHLERKRPAGDVVRRGGRSAGIFEIVRMILGLEHVHHVRAEGLRGFHDVRAGRVMLSGDV